VGALGDDGPDYLINLYIDELRASLGQIGARTLAEARAATIRHPGAIEFAAQSRPRRSK
jgi:L-lactate dehydrogenase (cytochrome)